MTLLFAFSFLFFSFPPLPTSPFLFLAVKGITYTNLIHLSIFWGKGTSAYEKGSFSQTWGYCSDDHILFIYNSFHLKLPLIPYGHFDTLSLLIGDKNAYIFCEKDHLDFTHRPPSLSN